MTDHTPPTDQQLDDIEARANAARHCPNAEANGRRDGQHTLSGSFSHIRCELCTYSRPRGERVEETAALVAEVRRLRNEVAILKEERRLEWITMRGQTPHTPRICACGHTHHAHTVPAPHSCFAHGQTCPCPAYRQLPHDEAVAQLKRNQKAAAERAAAVPAVETGR